MKNLKYLFIFLLGAVASLLFIYYIYFQYCKQNWTEQGRHEGRINAQFELYHSIDKIFGKQQDEKILGILFTIKDTDVLIIEKNGTRTIRTRR